MRRFEALCNEYGHSLAVNAPTWWYECASLQSFGCDDWLANALFMHSVYYQSTDQCLVFLVARLVMVLWSSCPPILRSLLAQLSPFSCLRPCPGDRNLCFRGPSPLLHLRADCCCLISLFALTSPTNALDSSSAHVRWFAVFASAFFEVL
ncbi:hypothetical protein TcWFU_000441 [Taenia crassiceps]|uniref:Uncharacterized protein n=1 Tax=Taenia crassiceps TaxID=6207 RepID=A0ABR4QJW6_9CEST